MRQSLHLAYAIVALGMAGAAWAQQQGPALHYRWVDGSGTPHYSDSLTDDALKYGYDTINSEGLVVGHVARTLTPAERDAAAAQQAQRDAAQQAIEDKKRADLLLVNTYADENALKNFQQAQLDSEDGRISATIANLHSQDNTLTDLLNRAADNERQKEPVPKFLTDQIAQQRSVVANERALLQRQKTERAQTIAQQAAILQRYRDLKAAQKAANGG